MNILAFQEYLPTEQKESGHCIWCGTVAPANRAHVISRKLTKQAKNAPTLQFRVCETCNSLCGELEQWILRRTPLSFVRMMLYVGATAVGRSQYPSYFYSELLEDWVVFQLDSTDRSYRVSTQLILSNEDRALLLTEEPEEIHEEIQRLIEASIRTMSTRKEVRPSLPQDFAPRLLLLDYKTVVVIGKTDVETEEALQSALLLDQKAEKRTRLLLNNTGRVRHHFQWSKSNWARFCAKTALEALCLFEGGSVCLRPEFDRARDFVMNGTLSKGQEIVFDQTGPKSESDVPVPVYLDLTVGQAAPKYSKGVLPHTDMGSHIVLLYEISGWISASVVFSGFPASVLMLAGPNVHLKDFYQLIYDYEESQYHFLRLAYDSQRPIIPFPLPGSSFIELAMTYKLHEA